MGGHFVPCKSQMFPTHTKTAVLCRDFAASRDSRDSHHSYKICPICFSVDESKDILELTIPIAFGVVVMAIFLIVLTVWCYRKKSNNRQSPRGNRDSRAIESRNRLLGLEIEQQRDYAGRRPGQDESIRYSDMLRNDILNEGVPLNYGPPPSYDEISRNDSLNRSRNLECPPSYETAMSESTSHNPQRLNQTTSGVGVTANVDGHTPREDPSSRLLNQLQPNTSNEVRASERSEVFV